MQKIRSSEITPEHIYLNRRQFMKAGALTAGAIALAACGVAKETAPAETAVVTEGPEPAASASS